jgi:hypothetical protein
LQPLGFAIFRTRQNPGFNTAKGFEKSLEFFHVDTVLPTSKFNEEEFEHFKDVVVFTLARLLGKEIEELSWMLTLFPRHYKHPNSATSDKKSVLFTQKPMNLCETSNSDMCKIMEEIQLQYLKLIGEQSEDKEKYFQDLTTILDVDGSKEEREVSEGRVKDQIRKSGSLILHGDLLTDLRFETCKRSRRGNITAFERYDYMEIFRLGMFHLHMNKTIQVNNGKYNFFL